MKMWHVGTIQMSNSKNSKKDNQDIHISLLHLNISSLPHHINNLTNLLCDLDFEFEVIAVT